VLAPTLQPRLILEQIGDVTVVKFTQPELLEEAAIQAVAQQLFQLVDQLNHRRLVLNLEGVERLSASLVGTFLALHQRTRAGGGRFVLCGVARDLMKVLAIYRLPSLIQICREEQEALQAF
jgi:anti-sigma B factor antagonist